MTIKADGNVGIGTTSPIAKLHIKGSKSYSLGYLDANSDLHIGNQTMSSAVGAYAGSITFGSTNEAQLQAASIVAIQTDTDPNEIGLAFFTQHSQFGSTDLVESMRIRNDGNVGIGTTNPSSLLHIADSGSDVKLTIDRTDARTYSIYTNSSSDLRIKDEDASADRITIKSDGKVGINTGGSTLHNAFTVKGNTNINNGDSAFLTFNNGDASIQIEYNNADSVVGRDLLFKTYKAGVGNTEKMRINRDGNVTFAGYTSTPNSYAQNFYVTASGTNITNRIDNDGTQLYITYSGTSNRALEIKNSNGDATFASNAIFGGYVNTTLVFGTTDLNLGYAGGTSGVFIKGSTALAGNVGIGTTHPLEKLHVYNAGTARIEVEGTTGPTALKATNSSGSYGWYVPSGSNNFRLYNFNTSSDLITVNSDGDATFAGNVTIDNGTSSTLTIEKDGTGGGKIQFNDAGSQKAYIALDSYEHIVYYGAANVGQYFYAGGVLNETKTGTSSTFAGTISSGAITAGSSGTSRFTDTGAYPLQLNRGLAVDSVGAAGVILGLGAYSTGTTYVDAVRVVGVLEANGTDGDLQLQVLNSGSYVSALTLNNDNNATFAGNVTVGGGQILTPSGTNLALNPNTGTVSVGGVIQCSGSGASSFTGGVNVSGDLNINSGSSIHGTIKSSSSSLTLNARNTGIMLFQSGGSEKMRIASSGNVGIGTTSPFSKLSINSNGAPTTSGNVASTGLTIHNGSGGTAIQIGTNDSAYSYIQSTYVNASNNLRELRFILGSQTSLRLDTSNNAHFTGNVTINAGNLFLANSSSRISNGANGEIGFNYNTSATGSLVWYGGVTTSKFSVTNAGNATFAGTITATDLYLNDTNTRLSEGSGNSVRITTSTGQIDIGSQNGSWIHFIGNRPYYFNQDTYFDSNVYPYSTAGARNLGRTANVWNHVYAKGYFIDSTEVIDASRNLINIGNITLSSGAAINFTVPSSGGNFININHAGNEAWTIGAQSGSGVDDYLDIGISGGTRAMSWHETGNVGIGTTTPGTLHGAAYGTTRLQIDGGTDRGQMIIEGDTDASIVLSDNGATANERVFATNVGGGKYTIKPLNDNGTSTAGGVAFTVSHGGNVGIGTTSPSVKLEVKSGGADDGFYLQRSSNTNPIVGLVQTGTGDGALLLRNASNSQTVILRGQGNSSIIGGNVGIGILAPTFKLHVKSDDSNDDIAYIHHDNPSQSSGTVLKVRSDAGDSSGYSLLDVSNNTGNALYVRGDRNVGIGTTSPAAKLQVYSTATRDIFISGHGTQAQNNWQGEHAFFISAGQGVIIGKANANNNTNRLHILYNDSSGNANYLAYNTSNTAKIHLNTNGNSYLNGGNVGIGTTSPQAKLHVGVGHIMLDAGYSLQWDNTHERIEQSDGNLEFFVNNGQRVTINSAGLDVDGIATANTFRTDTSNTDYNVISRNSTSTTLWVQAAQSGSIQGIASFRYGSATVNQGTEVCAIRKNSSYFINTKLGVGTNNPSVTLDVDGPIKHKVYTVSTLPSASPAGQRAFVSDSSYSLSQALGLVTAGSGSNFCPMYSDGTNWRVG
jgi:lipopolysaccharide export system protein LptA